MIESGWEGEVVDIANRWSERRRKGGQMNEGRDDGETSKGEWKDWRNRER